MSASFRIKSPVLAVGAADRSEDLREPERLARAWSQSRVVLVDPTGRVHTDSSADGIGLRWGDPADHGECPPLGAVMLGVLDGVDHWAVPVDLADGAAFRDIGALLSDNEAGLLTTAVAVLAWHHRGGFCPSCGAPSEPDAAGWSRMCAAGHQEWPRTDPAVIVLVHDGADRIVLARQPSWPTGRVSVLAGFTEAGESLEATVVREIGEEVGLLVDDVQYLGSQPWPFPRSLMVGFAARADGSAVPVPRAGEIESARWFHRDEIRELLAAGGSANGVILPSEVSIARRMIEGWANPA